MIRVLHVTSTPSGIGGVERLLIDMAPHYQPERFHIAHCNLFDRTGGLGPFPAALEATGLRVHRLAGHRFSELPHIIANLRRLILSDRIDVLHLHMVHATVTGWLASTSLPGVRLVVSKHYSDNMIARRWLARLDRGATRAATHVVGVSRSIAEDVVRYGVERDRVSVIHNGIDLDAFEAQAEQAMLLDGNSLTIGAIGNLHARKGHDILVRAIPVIRARFPALKVVVIGEGPEREPLRALARSLRVEDAIEFSGHCENVASRLATFDLYVHPSRHEPFGIALLEAMALRKAVVATRVGGIPEVVNDGVSGRLVPSEDPHALAAAVIELLANPERRAAMGSAGRTQVERDFSVRGAVLAYEALYSKLAARAA